tara:strand:+ start:660 stop:2144 length:1485 start_codon:yes stop_codon:yes gene_type:complete
MKLNEQELKSMIKKSLQKAFSQNTTGFDTNQAVTDNFVAMDKMKSMAEEESDEETTEESSDVLNQILTKIVQDEEGGETTEATGAGSAGGFSAPLFTEPKKNMLFQPGTETSISTKPEGGPVNEDKIKGGKADGMDIMDVAKIHGMSVDELYNEFSDGVKHEMEHTSEMMVAIEIALDHLYEDPEYYTKLSKIEKGGETTEATTSSSVGVYDAPFGSGKKDPLKLSNPDTVEKELRSVRDKNFPKFGGKGGKYVKVKKKCSKFPYCNQGDINSLEFFERAMVKEMITNTAKKTKVKEYVVKNIIAKELGYITEQDDEEITINLPDPQGEVEGLGVSVKQGTHDDYKQTSSEDHRKEWLDSIPDEKARFLQKEIDSGEFDFKIKDLSGKYKVIDIGPKGRVGGMFGDAKNYVFSDTKEVTMMIDLTELRFKGENVPVRFYEMISRYLPPEEEEDSYRGDPVESAIIHGNESINRLLKSLGLYMTDLRINPYARFR